MTELCKSSKLWSEIPGFHKCLPFMPATFAEMLAEYGPDAHRRPRPSLQAAQDYCCTLARTHYENFTVVSWLLPRSLRQPFADVYAYCRWADDLADEVASPDQATLLLDWWELQLNDCYTPGHESSIRHPVFVALAETIRRYQIPSEPFRDLLSAFRQDQRVTRYQTPESVLDYCRRSANPVGRLVLYLSRIQDPESQQLSDHICTGLQLANFCQDVANDLDRGRVYLPQSTLREVGYTDAQFCRREYNAAFRKALQIEVDRAERQLQAGKPLVERIPRELQFDVSLFIAGGLAILNAIRRQDYNVWKSRPALSKSQKLAIAAREWFRSQFEPRQKLAIARSSATSRSELIESYTHCRQLARRSASNFAWAFCLLPARKRQAMYALYAFLRRTDDLGDNPSPVEERRMDLHAWRNSLERAMDGTYDDPILPALADTVHRFAIPAEHLHAVIDGVLFDCGHYDPDQPRFATFLQLECYCEQVASAVGMACIHIWGFKDRAAYEPARQCGIAFQLTNILRDLRQDAAEGRIYLPQEDFSCTGYAPADLRNGVANTRFHSLVDLEVERALASYRVAEELIPLLDPSARRIYRTMLNTYRSLLDQICEDPAMILRQRVGLSRWRKLKIVGRSWFASNKPLATGSTARFAPSTLV